MTLWLILITINNINMAQLHHLLISHFRGIECFECVFNKGITCIIGRGDSGKSTILDAIGLCFSQSWSIHLNDSDFFNTDTTNPIIIEGTVIDLPQDLIDKFSDHIRGVTLDGHVIDDMESEDAHTAQLALTVQLKVGRDLEPIWSVISNHGIEPSMIKATDRSKMNVFQLSDYTDRHFSLNKGNPLYSLYKELNNGEELDDDNRVLDVIRDAKEAFDNSVGNKFDSLIDRVKTEALKLGISLNEMKAMLDHRDIAISENKVSIHENGIPLRLKGKGSKRIVSLAIQLAVTRPAGVILIDEIEQGLEPDRVQHLVNELAKNTDKQVIMTTHSSNVIVEVPCESVYIKRSNNNSLLRVDRELQNCIRKNPEVFFATKVIVCEGVTEIGLCRAINKWRMKNGKLSAACNGVRFADGGGNSLKNYVVGFNQLKYDTALFCDSDPQGDEINKLKPKFKNDGINVVDCETGLSIEGQIFKDAPWIIVKELLKVYAERLLDEKHSESIEEAYKSIFDSITSKMSTKPQWSDKWYENESQDLRESIAAISGKKSWFKRIDLGEKVGDCILLHYSELEENCHLKKEIDDLSGWMDS